MKALVILGSTSLHPYEDPVLKYGKFKCIFLPKNTTSGIQPMDQGVILAAKRDCRKRFLSEIIVVLEDEDEEGDTSGERTLQNSRNDSLMFVVFCFAASVEAVSVSALVNGWRKLLHDAGAYLQLEGFEADDCKTAIEKSGRSRNNRRRCRKLA
jgi:hypothetical protein